MEKKSKKADLERKRTLFFQIGLVIALSLILAAFEWRNQVSKNVHVYQIKGIELETEMVPVTRQKEIKPPLPKQYEKFEIVENDETIKDEYLPVNTESFEDDEVIFQEFIGVDDELDDEEVYFIADKQPEPPGGFIGLKHYLKKHIKYPVQAVENNIQGKVYVRFTVNKKGKIENVSVFRGVHPLLDKEALRVVNSLPDWKPGEQAGKPVNVSLTIPIVFVLE